VDKIVIDEVLVLLNAEVAGADFWSPIVAILAWRNTLKVTSIQGRNTNLSNLVVCFLIRLDIDAHEDYGTVKRKRCRNRGINSSRHALRNRA
jgi:hypothetical protein